MSQWQQVADFMKGMRQFFPEVPEGRWKKLMKHDRVLEAKLKLGMGMEAGMEARHGHGSEKIQLLNLSPASIHSASSTTTPAARTRAESGFTRM